MKHKYFIGSISLGVFIWIITFVVLPINISKSISANALWFLLASFSSIIFGYFLVDNKQIITTSKTNQKHIFFVFVLVAFIGFISRYLDLFYFRECSFSNNFLVNRINLTNYRNNAPIILSILGILRSVYFAPIIIVIILKSKNRIHLIFSILLVLLTIFESILLGTRKHYFILFLVITISFFVSRKWNSLFSFGFVLKMTLGLLFLFSMSYYVVKDRLQTIHSTSEWKEELTSSRYNDFVPLKEDFKLDHFDSKDDSLNSRIYFSLAHIGQYIVHGIFELDYIIRNEKLPRAKGKYTFYPILKLTNRLGLTKSDLTNTSDYHPRDYVYITFFGGLYVDFGWFSLIFSFLYGLIFRRIYEKSKSSIFFKLILIHVILINISLPIFSLIRGGGLYPFFTFLFVFLLLYFLNHITQNEKSFNP